MTYQNRMINRIIQRAGDIGATVEIEYSDYGTASIDVNWNGSSTCAGLFVIIGKRGGVRYGQYSDLLDMFYTFDKNASNKWMRVWDFFKTVERQKKLTLTLEDKLNAHRGAAA
jgi:hypothetical protein